MESSSVHVVRIIKSQHALKYRFHHRHGLFMSDSEATNDDSTIIRSLEDTLKSIGIQVADGSVQQLIDQRDWIYSSERIETMLEVLNQDQLYSIFNYKHHLYSSTQLFSFLAKRKKKVSVVYGHKTQGKTQFLFFVLSIRGNSTKTRRQKRSS
jgi:hypothetical protein